MQSDIFEFFLMEDAWNVAIEDKRLRGDLYPISKKYSMNSENQGEVE